MIRIATSSSNGKIEKHLPTSSMDDALMKAFMLLKYPQGSIKQTTHDVFYIQFGPTGEKKYAGDYEAIDYWAKRMHTLRPHVPISIHHNGVACCLHLMKEIRPEYTEEMEQAS